MKGWHTQVAGEYERPTGVIGVVVAPKFPDHDIIREKIREGVARRPDDVWVIREKPQANHAVTVVWDTLTELGVEPILVPLLPALVKRSPKRKVKVPTHLDECEQAGQVLTFVAPIREYDYRREYADAELRRTCERVIVFHDKSSQVTANWGNYDGHDKPYEPGRDRCVARIFVIERGKKKAVKRRTGRKPVGV